MKMIEEESTLSPTISVDLQSPSAFDKYNGVHVDHAKTSYL